MQSKEISDGNKLIAEFMGYVARTDLHTKGAVFMQPPDSDFAYILDKREDKFNEFSELEFNTSWDWLMPVGKKISDIFDKKVKSKDCMIDGGELFLSRIMNKVCYFKIEKLWVAIVEYIEWYNINESNQA